MLPTYDVFDEDRYFERAGELAPVLFRGKQLGITICEDIWNDVDFWPKRRYARDPVTELVAKGAEILINISASPFTLGKPELRSEMLRQMAAKHEKALICVNQICGQDDIVFDGHSQIIDAKGRLVLALKGFEEDFAVYDLDAATSPILRERKKTRVEQAHAALLLGLRDYVSKCGFTEVVLGLSGGIDSALTACLAARALGADKVLGVSMPGRYSSEHSKDDALELTENLGIRYDTIPIEEPFQAYLNCLADAFRGRSADVTEENLQARVRGAILMALSNKTGSLLLSTGNKSELAVGYCTLYGDMCGGLAVLSDVPKTLLYEIAAYVNRDHIIIPTRTLEKAPSAELRPDQVDQDSLPPYDVLDRILELYVEENRDLDEIVEQGFDRAVVSDLLQRIDRNVYKRRQAAPGIKISSKAFGTGRRFPIAARY